MSRYPLSSASSCGHDAKQIQQPSWDTFVLTFDVAASQQGTPAIRTSDFHTLSDLPSLLFRMEVASLLTCALLQFTQKSQVNDKSGEADSTAKV